MFDDLVWINPPRCFAEIAGLRAAAPTTPTVRPATIGIGPADEMLRQLAALVEQSALGVRETVNAMADTAMLTVLGVIDADNR